MHRLTALTRGPMTPSPRDGRVSGFVHSVFERVCNLKLDDGTFLAVSREDVSNGPGVIRCHTSPDFSFAEAVYTDEPVAVRGGILRIGQSVHTDLRSSALIERHVPGCEPNAFRDHSDDHLSVLHAHPANDRVESLLRPAETSLRDLPHMVGKGPGLTPAGDDFIVGVAAGLASSDQVSEEFRTWLREAALRTTELSGKSLIYAAEGWFVDPILDYIGTLNALPDGAPPPKLLSIGDTSGIAMAHGVLRGLAEAVPSSKIGITKNPNHQEAA